MPPMFAHSRPDDRPGAGGPEASDVFAPWRCAIVQGNTAFTHADYGRAIAHYEDALHCADRLFGRVADADAGAAAWVVAHHNLADTYARQERPERQRGHLWAAHEGLCAAVADPSLSAEWRAAAARHSRRTHAELLLFLKEHPDDPNALSAGPPDPAGGGAAPTVH